MKLRIGSLFSGYGGLEMGVQAVLGSDVAWHCENDPAASRVLAHHWPDVPNLGDITVVDWTTIEPVDVLTGGFPCQPVSCAGKRAGTSDNRWLFDEIVRAIGGMGTQPRLCVFENVPGLLTANRGDAMARVVQGLASVGYVGRWRVVRAADIGAPHGRARVFIVAWPTADTISIGSHRRGLHRSSERWRPESANGSFDAPDAESDGRHQGRPEPAWDVGGLDVAKRSLDVTDSDESGWQGCQPAWRQYVSSRGTASDTNGRGCEVDSELDGHKVSHATDRSARWRYTNGHSGAIDWGKYAPAIARWERVLGRVAPAPTELGTKGQPRLSPAFVEWLMGLPFGWVTGVPGVKRNDQLGVLGNGVVPQQAAMALRLLLPMASAA